MYVMDRSKKAATRRRNLRPLMSEASVVGEVGGWHKRFAMSCNNRAWELSVQDRTPSQDREMLETAHASAWHWSQIGTELNRMRATMLLAEVHALLGYGSSAISYAREMRTYFLGQDTPDWELAFTHAIYAHAAFAAGDLAEHRSAYHKAVDALRAIADEDDRSIVAKTFSQVPPP
jgi:hypothetical protein